MVNKGLPEPLPFATGMILNFVSPHKPHQAIIFDPLASFSRVEKFRAGEGIWDFLNRSKEI